MKKTKLIWQKCSLGQNNDEKCSGKASTYSWDDAVKNCESLQLADKKWRLPTKEELESIIVTDSKPSINQNLFPSTEIAYYWTSTITANDTNSAWFISFSDGYMSEGYLKEYPAYARCVSSP